RWQPAVVCLVALALLAASPAPRGRAQAVSYTITDLGTLGGVQSRAFGIDNCGRVVGDSSPAASSSKHPFFWSDDNGNGVSDPGEMKDLGTLGADGATASAGKRRAVAAGNAATGTADIHAFIWSAASGERSTGTLLGDSPAAARDIS